MVVNNPLVRPYFLETRHLTHGKILSSTPVLNILEWTIGQIPKYGFGVTSSGCESILWVTVECFVGWLMVKSVEQHLRCITVNIKNETCIVNSEHELSISWCRISSINRTMLSSNLTIIGLLMFFLCKETKPTRLRFRVRFLKDPTLNCWVPLMNLQTGIWKWGRFTTFNWKISYSCIVWVLIQEWK